MATKGMGDESQLSIPLTVTLKCACTLTTFYFRCLYNCKDIILRRNTAGSLGFCIVGGYEEYNGNKPFFIKSIVEGTPAYNDGRIR